MIVIFPAKLLLSLWPSLWLLLFLLLLLLLCIIAFVVVVINHRVGRGCNLPLLCSPRLARTSLEPCQSHWNLAHTMASEVACTFSSASMTMEASLSNAPWTQPFLLPLVLFMGILIGCSLHACFASRYLLSRPRLRFKVRQPTLPCGACSSLVSSRCQTMLGSFWQGPWVNVDVDSLG